MCSLRELHVWELLIFLFAAKLSKPTALQADSIWISSSLKKLWIPLVPFLGQALTSLCLLTFRSCPQIPLCSSHHPQVPQKCMCLTAAIFPGTIFKGLSVTRSYPCRANLSLTLSPLQPPSSLNSHVLSDFWLFAKGGNLDINTHLSPSARTVITYHRLGGICNRNRFLWGPAWLGTGEDSV